MKIKQTRKEILSVFTNWVIECKVIAIERHRFKETPNWQSSKAVKGFTEGFYRKTRDKLQHRAKLRGIRVLEIEPAYTSQYCHKCNKKAKTDKLTLKCECGRHDRDYNASVKIIKESMAQIRQGLASQMWCGGVLRNKTQKATSMDGHTRLWIWIDGTVFQ